MGDDLVEVPVMMEVNGLLETVAMATVNMDSGGAAVDAEITIDAMTMNNLGIHLELVSISSPLNETKRMLVATRMSKEN